MKKNQVPMLMLMLTAILNTSVALAQEPTSPDVVDSASQIDDDGRDPVQPATPTTETTEDGESTIDLGALACAPLGAGIDAGIGAILGSGVGIASGGTAMAGTIPLAKTGAVIGGQGAVLAALALGIDCIGLAGLAADLAAQGSAATTDAAARAVNWLRNKLADHIGHTTEPVITAYDWYIAYDVAEWPHPRSHRTATAATLYPPPYSDPEDLLNFIRDQLQR